MFLPEITVEDRLISTVPHKPENERERGDLYGEHAITAFYNPNTSGFQMVGTIQVFEWS